MRQIGLFTGLMLLFASVFAQPYPQNYFAPPLQIPLVMSGTFGELRHNHFHAGVDFKTQGREGLPILAAAEGYVSRVKVSPTGYGLAIYIDHPNGYTTVYGHLRAFYPELAAYVEEIQYTMESYAIDVYPEPGKFSLRQGQQIGEGGNSGSSGGPHLHFEIRKTQTEVPVHPLLFGFAVLDNRPPVLQTLYIYEKATGSIRPNRKQVQLRYGGGQYHVAHSSDTLLVTSPRIAFGLYTYDQANGANNRNGIYSLQLKVEDQPYFGFTLEGIPFNESKYINSHIDYCYQRESRRRIHTCYLQPGNGLSVYDTVVQEGWVTLAPGEARKVHMAVNDPMGNGSTVTFWVKYTGTLPNARLGKGAIWVPQRTHKYMDSVFQLTLPAWSLYDTLQVNVVQESSGPPVYAVGEDCVPLHYGVEVAIRTELPDVLRRKAVLMVEREGLTYPQLGHWKEDWLYAHSPYFGRYYVDLDTVKPKIELLQPIVPGNRLAFRITDDRTGIHGYNATWNGKWVWLAYDAKRNILTGQLPLADEGAEQIFRLAVSDYCENASVYTKTF